MRRTVNSTLEVFRNVEADVTFEIAYALRQKSIDFGQECTSTDLRARFDLCIFKRGMIVCVVEVKKRHVWTQRSFYSTYGYPLLVCRGRREDKKTVEALVKLVQAYDDIADFSNICESIGAR